MLKAKYIPNAITSARILCVPCLIWMLFHHQFERSLILVLLMGVSDALDGFLARCYGWKTALGAYLDPLADKLMLLSTFIAFAALGWVPWWLAAIIVARDVILLTSAFYYHLSTRQLKIEPLTISKINTFAQIILAASLIYAQVGPLHVQILNVLMTIVACTTVGSGMSYAMEWSRRASKYAQKHM
ncbi:MAG: CDP-alcohol phosphatidyltransferase family protein [Gammaproteobacteria bacterium]|nr:CDP-alcohol phosphatidyltransferase family protein [Gammaproteobacteria bacterium]